LRTAQAMVNGPAWKALIEEEFGDGIIDVGWVERQ
jgi:cyanate lyase